MTAAASRDEAPNVAERAEAATGRSRKRAIAVVVLALGAAGAGGWMLAHRGLESTDDAQIDAEVVALAARAGGVVVEVGFEDNERVEAGRVLAELDPEPAKAKLAQAEANLEAARAAAAAAETDASLAATNAKASSRAATASLSAASAGASASREQIAEARARVSAAETSLAQAKLDLDRVTRLSRSGALSQAQLDQATTAHSTAEASVAQTRASLAALESNAAQAASRIGEASARVDQTKDVDAFVALAEARARGARAKVAELEAARDLAALELSYTKIVAPQAGVVSKKNVAVGQTLSAGAPIAQLVPSAKGVWVTANFKETQLGKMRPGQPAEIHVDALPGRALHGSVESISAATGSRFALLPPDNATGNFTKVVQRVPVRVKLDGHAEGVELRPGMSVELTVDTRK
ncbi:MAG: HlyD family secretion protein [Labilithrix sp.]|nr:HlyD family secretion protein [Labilithrix sp.]MCW5832371.1 HlyD family secretion protein [Labilithrix sp.]